MKRLIAFIMALVMFMGMSMTAFAADEEELGSDDFYSEVSGSYKVVSKRVVARKTTYKVTGYNYPEQAKDVFRIMNMERAAAGVPKLTWEAELVQPAIQRALEAYVEWSHTRPNGKDALTVSSLANGENLAMGDIDAVDVMEGWMNSPDHKSNILDTDFTSVAVACVATDQGCYWVQLFHADKKVSSSKSGSNSKSGSDRDDASDSGSVTAKSLVAALEKAKTSAQTASVTLKNKESVSPAALKAMSDWGATNKKTVSLSATTTNSNGKGVQGQITLSPSGFVSSKNNLKLGVWVDEESTASIRKSFEKKYANNMSVIKLGHTGDFITSVNITAKADLTALNTKNLVFYSYNPSTKKTVKLSIGKDGYSIDKNKYLRFSTNKGGYIIVSDGDLVKQ